MDEIISHQIRQARKDRGLTQKEVAAALGHQTSNSVSKIERGNVKVSASDLYQLSELFAKPIQFFFGFDYGGEKIEDVVAIIEVLTEDEISKVKTMAKEMAGMNQLSLESVQDDPKIGKREVLERAYRLVTTQSLLMSEQLDKLTDLKQKYEIELGLQE